MNSRVINIAAVLGIVAIVIYACVIAKALLIPFVCAVVVWYLTIEVTELLQQMTVGKWEIPFSIAILIALSITSIVLYMLFEILSTSIYNVVADAPQYQAKLLSMFSQLEKWTGREVDASKILGNVNLTSFISTAAHALTSLAGNLLIITIYVLFLLIEYKTFDVKLRAICHTNAKYSKVKEVFARMRQDTGTYLKIKTAVSLLTGFSSYLILLAFGIRNAQFWGMVIFLMNFIPTIGSIVAVTLTLLAVSIQFNSMGLLLVLAMALTAVQVVIGNVIEPKYMGKHLNLSPVVILLSLAIWGSIWGVIGMLLCVPGTTIISIILSNFKETRPVAILLSADGKI